MPYLDNHDKIKQQADAFKMKAPEGGWERIESRLTAQKLSERKKKARILRFISTVAASAALVIAFFSIVYMESSKPQVIPKAQVENWEDLNDGSDYFYSVQNARRSNGLFQEYQDALINGSLEGTSGLPVILRNDPI